MFYSYGYPRTLPHRPAVPSTSLVAAIQTVGTQDDASRLHLDLPQITRKLTAALVPFLRPTTLIHVENKTNLEPPE